LLLVLTWRPHNSIANSFGRTPQKETLEILENSVIRKNQYLTLNHLFAKTD
jgi:hypothetical protein